MGFENVENFGQKSQENKQEQKEKKAEEIIDKRGGLFSRILQSIVEEKRRAVKDTLEMDEDQKKFHELLKKVPFLRGHIVSTEGVVGAEPGKKLNTQESLIKVGIGSLMFTADVMKLKKKKETGEVPENVFKGKTLEFIREKTEESREENPESKSSKFWGAVSGFFEGTEEIVEHYEDRLYEISEKGTLDKTETDKKEA
jgi:hypothetical protein|tara:strand:+ start:550 stop:1146 length:597 start_codon:yes stop_codon:yes gene_type:complete